MLELRELLRQLRINLFGSPDYTAGNKAEIMRRLRVLLEADKPRCTALIKR